VSVNDVFTPTNRIALAPTAARTATGQGSAVDVRQLIGVAQFIFDCAAGTGTAPTMTVNIQDSADGSTGWSTIRSFTGVTTVASVQDLGLDVRSTRGFLRAQWTIGGTTPSYSFSVNGLAMRVDR
jgi:hypothetical protein